MEVLLKYLLTVPLKVGSHGVFAPETLDLVPP